MRWAHPSLAVVATIPYALCGVRKTVEAALPVSAVTGGIGSPRELQNISIPLLDRRQAGARCGPGDGNNAKCPNGQCCSDFGFCGDTNYFCNTLFCQPEFGACGSAQAQPTEPPPPPPPPPPPTTTTTTTTTRTTTRTTTTTTTRSTSQVTVPSSTTGSIPVPSGTTLTLNGMCGNGTTCAGSKYGNCCSQYFYCGASDQYCGSGCQALFGLCGAGVGGGSSAAPPSESTTTTTTAVTTSQKPTTTTTTTEAPPPPPPPPPTGDRPPAGQTSSTDGTCGGTKNCLGSNFGRCCSQYGYCGDSPTFCDYIAGCDSDHGYCNPQ